jgi:hypothetical protein
MTVCSSLLKTSPSDPSYQKPNRSSPMKIIGPRFMVGWWSFISLLSQPERRQKWHESKDGDTPDRLEAGAERKVAKQLGVRGDKRQRYLLCKFDLAAVSSGDIM